jgi:hypothetical protein
LPVEAYSHALRRLAAVESTQRSFSDADAAVERATGQRVRKREVEALAAKAAPDLEGFGAIREATRIADATW